jgi:hypothetical protein
MKTVKVIYTTTEAFAVQNQQNIRRVMADLQQLDYPGIRYNACLSADGCTFIHTAFFKTDYDQQLLNELPSFKLFQEELKAGMPVVPPKVELLELVGTSAPIFND